MACGLTCGGDLRRGLAEMAFGDDSGGNNSHTREAGVGQHILSSRKRSRKGEEVRGCFFF